MVGVVTAQRSEEAQANGVGEEDLSPSVHPHLTGVGGGGGGRVEGEHVGAVTRNSGCLTCGSVKRDKSG